MKPDLEKSSLHFLDYWRVIKSRKEIILAVILIVVMTGTGVTFLLTPTYKSTCSIRVNQDDADMKALGRSQSQRYSPYFLATEYQVIKSRPILRSVANNLDLPHKWAQKYKKDGGRLEEKFVIDRLQGSIRLEQIRNTSVIEISVYRDDPQEAANIANRVAEEYHSNRERAKIREYDEGLDALKVVARGQENKVIEAERRVEDVREEHDISLIAEDYTIEKQAISTLLADKIKYEVDMVTKKTRMDRLNRLQGEELAIAVSFVTYDQSLSEIVQRLNSAKENKAVLQRNLGPKHPDILRVASGIIELEKQLSYGVSAIRESLLADFEIAKARYEKLESELSKVLKEDIKNSSKGMLEFDRAVRDKEMQRNLYDAVEARMLTEAYDRKMPRNPVEIFEPAEAGSRPVSPNLVLNILLSIALGTLLGLGLAFFLEYLDTSVKTVDDIEEFLGLPVVGVIPQKIKLLSKEGPDSMGAEAYRLLRTNLKFNNQSAGASVFTVTSAGAGEGKSTTVFNLAYICSSMGDRVILVDADMRRPVQHKFFDVSNRIGLANVLMRDVPVEETIKTSVFPNFDFLPSGKLPRTAIGVIDVNKVRDLIKTLRNKYDIVFFDAPPIMGVSDASILASEVDGVLQVIQYRKYPRQISARAKRLIENVGGNIIGVVLNRINILRDDYYSYFQSYYSYTGDEEPERAPETSQPVDRF